MDIVNDLSIYYKYRPLIKTADLIEYRSNTSLFGWAIRKVTGQNVNHTSIAKWMCPKVSIDSNNGKDHRLYVAEAVQKFGLSYLSNKLRTHKGMAYWIALRPEYDDKRQIISDVFESMDGRPYDTWSLVRNLWCRTKIDPDKLFCSEVAQIALVNAGILSPDYSPTCKDKDKGRVIWPGEFVETGLYNESVRIL